MKTKRVFLDLDHTLYDTRTMFSFIRSDLQERGYTKEEIDHGVQSLADKGYSFESHLALLGYPPYSIHEKAEEYYRHLMNGNRFLLPHVLESLWHISYVSECHVLTYGVPQYQRRKYAGLSNLHPYITHAHFVWKELSKGDVIRSLDDGAQIYFVDDVPKHLLDVHDKVPHARLYRIAYPQFRCPPHEYDGVHWKVIHSLETLAHDVLCS